MKKFISYLLLATLISVVVFLSFAQQNQNTQQEIEALQKRVSDLESKLQTVENVEKMELAAKLAEAEAKLAEAEFDKFERELRDANDEWLKSWSNWFTVILGTFVVILLGVAAVFWFWLSMKANQLIADRVEEHLKGFKDAVEQVNIVTNQLEMLEEEYAAFVLERYRNLYYSDGSFPKPLKALRDEVLLKILSDETRDLGVRDKAAEILALRNNPQIVSPILEFLYSVVDSDLDSNQDFELGRETEYIMHRFVRFVEEIHTQESYEGLKKFLSSLITNNPQNKDLFLTRAAFSLCLISFRLNAGDSVSVLRLAIPHLQVGQSDLQALRNLAKYFDVFDNPEGIKEILTHHAAGKMPELEETCLNLLEKHDPDFVRERREEETTTNTENEESP